MIAFICKDNRQFSEHIANLLSKLINDKQSPDFRNPFICYQFFLDIKDNLTTYRVGYSMDSLMDAIQNNIQFFNEIDTCV